MYKKKQMKERINKRRIAIYARVSTEHEAQISALENQIQYYDELLAKYPDWILYDRYIDEGITGTSVNKRPSFIRMMEDAKNGCFDLIITREVSRFARNTVDTLMQTRILKAIGVEVWFIEDNIWTMNDEDGELRLSIMATLAQNESKKISSRVKAGQKISFLNGVFYGNGNILGYDRDGDKYIINEEQAETVRLIFRLYLNGYGSRKIQYELQNAGRRTAMGNLNWRSEVILRVLKNGFYCGRLEYRKQYIPDYLTQKKVNNHGEVEKVFVKGTQPAIISEEDFDKVQILLRKNTTCKNGKSYGKPLADNVWVRKTRCRCGHAMNRRVNYVSKTGVKTYTFQCYDQLHTGTPSTRKKRGLPIEGICSNKSFPQWKLEVQADFIFKNLLTDNKQEIYEIAMNMIKEGMDNATATLRPNISAIESYYKEIDKLKERQDVLLDMCTSGDISRERFREKNSSLETQIELLNEKIRKENEKNIPSDDTEKKDYLNELSSLLEFKINNTDGVPESVIEEYVDSIIVDGDIFTWRLKTENVEKNTIVINSTNLKKSKKNNINKNFNDFIKLSSHQADNLMCCGYSNTGCNR